MCLVPFLNLQQTASERVDSQYKIFVTSFVTETFIMDTYLLLVYRTLSIDHEKREYTVCKIGPAHPSTFEYTEEHISSEV